MFTESECETFLASVVDLERYPITQPTSIDYREMISKAEENLKATGCAQLRSFLRPEAVNQMRQEVEDKLDQSDETSSYQNPYLGEDNPELPADHPVRHFLHRRNKLLCRDRIDPDGLIIGLFTNDVFTRFVRDATGLVDLHPYADPISGMLVNVQNAGDIFPWHFDNNDLSVSFVLRNASRGGVFEYAPKLRAEDDPNYDGVKALLEGDLQKVTAVTTAPGDLQLFWGRFSLHRVTQVESQDARYSLIYGYAREPNVCASKESALATFGRFYPEHELVSLKAS